MASEERQRTSRTGAPAGEGQRAERILPAGEGARPGNWPEWTALLLAILAAFFLCLTPELDPDIWWHLKTGRLILDQGSVPRTDVFSFTAAGRPWVTHEWLSEVVFSSLFGLGGFPLLIVLKGLLAAAALGLAAAAALVGNRSAAGTRPAPWSVGTAAAGVLLGAPLLAVRAFARPHMFTALFLGAALLLLRLEQTTGRRRFRLALIPLFLLWANFHSGFVLGLLLVALAWTGDALSRRRTAKKGAPRGKRPLGADSDPPQDRARWKDRALCLALMLAATLINPNHVQALLYPLKLFSRSEVRGSILELRSLFHPDFRGSLFVYDLGVLVALLAFLLARAPRRDLSVLLPGAVFLLLALRSVRGVTEFAVLVPVLIGVHGAGLPARPRLREALAGFTALFSLALPALALGPGIPMGKDPPRKTGFGYERSLAPAEAADFLRQTRPSGEAFNVLGLGGYLIYSLAPERKVYVDGRLDVYPPEFLAAYGRLMSRGEGWDEQCRRYGITLAVLDYRSGPQQSAGLRGRLRNDPDWPCVFFSRNAVIYARRVPENAGLLDRFSCPFDPTQRSTEAIWDFARKAEPADLSRAVSSMEAMASIEPGDPFLPIVLGQMLDASGRSAEGAVWMKKALSLGPSSPEARLLLAGCLMRAGSLPEARGEVDEVLKEQPDRIEALLLQAEMEQQAGAEAEARRILTRAAALQPDNYLVQYRLGLSEAAAGNRSPARACFTKALALRPGDPASQRELSRLDREE